MFAARLLVLLALLVAPLAAEAQQTKPAIHTVGVLAPHDHYRGREYSAFIETLRSLGYDQGRNLRLLVRSAAGPSDRLPALAKELVDAHVDVIVAINTPGSGAARATGGTRRSRCWGWRRELFRGAFEDDLPGSAPRVFVAPASRAVPLP